MDLQERLDVLDRVATLAAQVAEVPSVDPARPLADVGFDSIAMAELAAAVEVELGVSLAEAQLQRLGTPMAIAEAVVALRHRPRGARIPHGIGRFQAFAEGALGPILRRWYRFEVVGADHVPSRGPAIVCANHNSLLDIPFLTVGIPRPIWFMAKVELFKGSVSSRFFHELGGFPVRRHLADLKAVDTALAIIESGRLLGMFPEGTRSPHELLPFLPGAAWIALVTGVPLVPAGIRGTVESLPPGRVVPKRTDVRVAFAPPIAVEREPDPAKRRTRAAEITLQLRRVVESLLS
jgi:1-acyl-sn-glycerol-3-phosphate acyltransferase